MYPRYLRVISDDYGDDVKFFNYSDDIQFVNYLPYIYPTKRRIAGSKRVERYQLEHGHRQYSGKGRLLQSITAHPSLSIQSFEVCVCVYYILDCLLVV